MARVQKPNETPRNARINCAFPPELKQQLEEIAALDEVSVNSIIERLCLQYVGTRTDDLAEYKKFREQIREKNSSTSDDELKTE